MFVIFERNLNVLGMEKTNDDGDGDDDDGFISICLYIFISLLETHSMKVNVKTTEYTHRPKMSK